MFSMKNYHDFFYKISSNKKFIEQKLDRQKKLRKETVKIECINIKPCVFKK